MGSEATKWAQPSMFKILIGWNRYGGLACILDGRPAHLDTRPAPVEKVGRRGKVPAESYARIMPRGRKDRGGHEEEDVECPTVIHDDITDTGLLGGKGRVTPHRDPPLHWTDFGNWWRFRRLKGTYYWTIGTMRAYLSITSYPGSTARKYSLVHGNKPKE